MLTIGRALMTNPQLLILDEATEGLAPKIAREIWAIVRRVRESGIATVIVDKNFKAVNAVTDRNVILVKGQVVFEGAAQELRERGEVRVRYSESSVRGLDPDQAGSPGAGDTAGNGFRNENDEAHPDRGRHGD